MTIMASNLRPKNGSRIVPLSIRCTLSISMTWRMPPAHRISATKSATCRVSKTRPSASRSLTRRKKCWRKGLPVGDHIGDDAHEGGEPENDGRRRQAADAVADQLLERWIEIDEDREYHEADDNDPISKGTHALGFLRHGPNGFRLLKRRQYSIQGIGKKDPTQTPGVREGKGAASVDGVRRVGNYRACAPAQQARATKTRETLWPIVWGSMSGIPSRICCSSTIPARRMR